ncbi:related to ELG1 protein required for S phase progression and telomere homeostasis [Cephalotrichum gorgonifer]|uniref:Related to ELG1 protein required for S phase progression and telomere homeostasis n=1 Tax=Cephalotrichum gorgonifer TaxID=2041049 RepID=A0AAE8N1H2_9PEZI|nr:related to ELG1 protein required for S phase progression and telomere homeostasis [Cephalotrichum gorgonifer]
MSRPNTAPPREVPSNEPNPNSDDQKAKKIIRFNPKTGTLGSPPRPKDAPNAAPSKTSPKPRGRPRKSRLVLIKYGRDDPAVRARMGEQISRILEAKQGQTEPGTPSNGLQRPKASVPKSQHPFFSKKSKNSPVPSSASVSTTPQAAADLPRPSRKVVCSSTPCAPPKSSRPPSHTLQFGLKSLGLKVPGATLPPWPPQGMVHVRGLEGILHVPLVLSQLLPQRKAKGHSVGISDEESILASLTRSTDVAAVAASIQRDIDNANEILPPPKELRLPEKHFESGRKVQRRMRTRLRTYQATVHSPGSSEDELGPKVHPVISRLFASLGTSLSAYDRSDCENSCWAQKYAPQSAAEILQPGKEAGLLKDWLLRLKVDSVSTGADSAARGKPASDTKAGARGKKKRKKAPLDGFIVDSDAEADDFDEISDGEDTWVSPGGKGAARTVIRNGDVSAKARDGRLTNAVVISGPHGCGKTATVYAVAKELDFEIFEINASSRRAGKDVLEKVGDMTRNHLVHHHTADQDQTMDEEQTAEEVKSGKQGTMTSFFKPKDSGAKVTPKTKSVPAKISPKTGHGTKQQKQSLILIEEADILYEEDKQFWVTITTLMAQSKRPFVITCNDESLLPFHLLNLHGIFRLNPPPVDLAVDAMLLIAANEGHVLERKPVEDLYETRGRDLRASLTELNYWCQLGVGDRRGGMDWFYLRWPKGSDLDENGDVVRVISESTYQSGMGWFGDSISNASAVEREEELVRRSWEAWGADCDELLVSDALAISKGGQTLKEYSDFADSMSSADMLSAGLFGQRFEERLDPTLPEISPRTKDDYILGRILLDAPLLSTHCPLTLTMPTAIKSLARRCLAPPPKPITEREAMKNIRSSLTKVEPLNRMDFSLAFDPIASSDKPGLSSHLDPSVFDRTMKMIVLDVAPFVRGIVAADEKRRNERLALGTLVSEGERVGGGGTKRRKTRSAMSALEGGERRTTRGERYFSCDVNAYLVLRTGGRWQGAVDEVIEEQANRAAVAYLAKRAALEEQARRAALEEQAGGGDAGKQQAETVVPEGYGGEGSMTGVVEGSSGIL